MVVLVAIAAGVAGFSIPMLYKASMEQQKSRLREIAHTEASQLMAVFHNEVDDFMERSTGEPVDTSLCLDLTLRQFSSSHGDGTGFGRTGEFVIAQKADGRITFLSQFRHESSMSYQNDSLQSNLAVPMQLALSGESGVVIGPNYRGTSVLAAYRYIPELNMGLVVKMDMAELREPFVRTAVYSGFLVLLFSLFGVLSLRRLVYPLLASYQLSEARYRSIVDNISLGICVIDRDFNILSINRVMDNWIPSECGDNRKFCLGLYDQDGFESRPEDCPAEMAFRDQQLHESVVRNMSETERRYRIVANPLQIENKVVTSVIVIAEDITDKEAREAELLKQEKLESIGLLAGGIAHDFNNILTAILGNISLVRMSVEDDELSTYLEDAQVASERARDLTQQLLTFSKGGAPIKSVTSLADLIEKSATFILSGSSSTCTVSITSDLHPVNADPGQLSQVINNITLNAAQSMDGGGEIRIAAANVCIPMSSSLPLDKGEYVRISIEDHGCGISEDDIGKIFDPYFSTKEHGSGLGLATCFSIIQKHGGHIDVSSEIGKGTQVCIYLPANLEDVESQSEGTDAVAQGAGRILVMDDERSIREYARTSLSSYGYAVSVVVDGSEALQVYQSALDSEEPFKVVVLDLTIRNGMGGLEASKLLRQLDPNVSLIVSSGYSNDPIMADFEDYGFGYRLAKPYRPEEIARAVQQVAAQASARVN